MNPTAFVVTVVAFLALVAAAACIGCFVLLGRNFTLRRSLAIARREKDDLIAEVRLLGEELGDQDHIIRTLTGAERWQRPDTELYPEDITGGDVG